MKNARVNSLTKSDILLLQKFRDVFSDDVEFKVDGAADFEGVEIREFVCVWNDADREFIVF